MKDRERAPAATSALRPEPAPYRSWGSNFEADSIRQMENACKLPISVAGALMPDAHVGYGLPIGGVLATDNAVIPYAVGVDIACRMKLTVLDLPLAARSRRSRTVWSKATRRGDRASASAPSSGSKTRAPGDGRGLVGHAGHRATQGQGLGAARDQRQRATTSSSSAC